MSDFSQQELNELSVELNQLEEEFSELNSLFDDQLLSLSGDDSSEELNALDAALEGTGIEENDGTGSSQLSLLDVIDGDFTAQSLEMQGWFSKIKRSVGGFLKNKVAKLIRKLLRLVRKYSKLKACIPAVTKAVVLFKAGRYASALKAAYAAYRCIKRRL